MEQNHSRYIYLFSAGHLFTDLSQGALPAILPFLIAAYHYNYAAVATLILASTVVSSVIQPVFGHLADKISQPWIMAAGVLLAGGGMAAVGFLSDFRLLFVAVMISGIGSAAYHPEATRLSNKVTGEKKGAGISIFSFGGNMGFTLGPVVSTISISLFGLRGIAVLAIPSLLMAAVILSQVKVLRQIATEQPPRAAGEPLEDKPDEWVPFSLLTLLLFGRSIVFYGLNTFLPLFWIQILQQSKSTGSSMLSVLFLLGAVCTLIGGRLGDRYGYLRIIRIGFLLLILPMAALTMTRSTVIATLLLIPIAYGMYSPSGLTVVLGQKYLPNRLGLAAGVTLGLSVSIGGIAAPVLGNLADQYGLMAAMYAIAAVSVIPAVLSFTLPNENKERLTAPQKKQC